MMTLTYETWLLKVFHIILMHVHNFRIVAARSMRRVRDFVILERSELRGFGGLSPMREGERDACKAS